MTTELVALDRHTCPTCAGELTRYSWGQPAMFLHAGYGATEVHTHRWCARCGWTITPDITTESPRLLSRNGVDTGHGMVFTECMSNTDTTPATFTTGRTYIMRWVTDAELETPLTVVRRTARFVTFAEHDGTEHRVGVRTDPNGSEYANPLGRYSMAPTVRAERVA